MADVQAPRDILAQVMADGKKVMVPMLAEMLKREGITEVPSDEERRRFWQRAKTDEEEAQLWRDAMAQAGTLELTPEQTLDIGLGISKLVYPDRWDMAPQNGRDTESAQARWAWNHARRGRPEPKPEEGLL